MFVQVLAAEADETRQSITLLVTALVGVAIGLALLTTWYWFYTDPKRRAAKARDRQDLDDAKAGDIASPVDAGPDLVSAGPRSAVDEWLAELMAPDPDEVDLVESEPIEVDAGRAPHDVEPVAASSQPVVEVVALEDNSIDAGPAEVVALATPRLRAVPEPPGHFRPEPTSERPSSERPSDGHQPLGSDQDGDELAVVRRRREGSRSGEGLSDEAWASIQRKVFNQLDKR